MPRVRDYAAEYARRQVLERERATREGREFSLTKARGHTSREYESVERQLRKRINETGVTVDREGRIIRRGYEAGKKPTTRGLQKRYGTDNLRRQLQIAKEAEKLYESGRFDAAKLKWQERDRNLPEWLFWYHGVFR